MVPRVKSARAHTRTSPPIRTLQSNIDGDCHASPSPPPTKARKRKKGEGRGAPFWSRNPRREAKKRIVLRPFLWPVGLTKSTDITRRHPTGTGQRGTASRTCGDKKFLSVSACFILNYSKIPPVYLGNQIHNCMFRKHETRSYNILTVILNCPTSFQNTML